MSIVLYTNQVSPPSRAVRSLLLLSQLPFREQLIDILKGDQNTQEYQKINPNQTIPAISDGSFNLYESNAILRYICNKKNLQQFYPTEIRNRAKIDSYLDWSATKFQVIIDKIVKTFIIPQLNKTQFGANQQEIITEVKEIIQFFEIVFLEGRYIFNQPSFTLADIKAVSDFSFFLLIGIDFNQYPKIKTYLQRMFCIPQIRQANKDFFPFVQLFPINESIQFIINGINENENWKINLYFHPWSSPSRGARTVLLLSGYEYNEQVIDLMKGENKKPEFQQINPNETIPAIKDQNFCLSESTAIMKYITHKYQLYYLYPKDAKERALVDQYLDFHINEMSSLNIYVYTCFFKPFFMKEPIPQNKEQLKKNVEDTINFFIKQFLNNGQYDYINGLTQPSLADIKAISDFAQLFVTDLQFNPILEKYISNLFTQLPILKLSHKEYFQFLSTQKINPFTQQLIKQLEIIPKQQLTLYYNYVSPPAKSVKSLLLLAKIQYKEQTVDLQAEENKKQWFTEINPNQTIPAISYGNFNLFESHSILKYLCIQFNLTQFYPNYPLRAKIDSYLDYHDTGMRFMGQFVYDFFYGPKFLNKPAPNNIQERIREVNQGFNFFTEIFLGGGKYQYIMGANSITIADLVFIADASSLFFVDFNFSQFPIIKEYLKNIFNNRFIRDTYSRFFLICRIVGKSMNPFIESVVKGTQEGESTCCQLI